MASIDGLVSDFKNGSLDRRSAIKQLLASSLSAPAAYSMLGYAMLSPSDAVAQSARSEELRKLADTLSRLVTSTEMINAIEQAEKISDKREAAAAIASEIYKPELMKKVGLDSDYMRTSLRVFELQEQTQQPLTVGIARSAGPYWTGKFEIGGRSRLTDQEFEQGLSNSNNSAAREAFRKGQTDPGALRQSEKRGICASYGKDLCASLGVP